MKEKLLAIARKKTVWVALAAIAAATGGAVNPAIVAAGGEIVVAILEVL